MGAALCALAQQERRPSCSNEEESFDLGKWLAGRKGNKQNGTLEALKVDIKAAVGRELAAHMWVSKRAQE